MECDPRNAGDDNIQIKYYFVLLLDIMGQEQQLAKWSQLQPDGTITDEMRAGLRGSLRQVLGLREAFLKLFRNFRTGNEQCVARGSIVLHIPAGGDRDRYNAISAPEIKLLHFSDTLVVYAPAAIAPGGDWNIKALYEILASVCLLMPLLLADRIPLRGALCIGTGAEAPDVVFYGPALAEAHRLESDVADYPRVVISESLHKFIRSRPAESAVVVEQFVRICFELCGNLVTKDTDGQVIIDYLGAAGRELLQNGPSQTTSQRDFVAKAREFVSAEIARLRNAEPSETPAQKKPRTNVAQKYARLLNYLTAGSNIGNNRKRP